MSEILNKIPYDANKVMLSKLTENGLKSYMDRGFPITIGRFSYGVPNLTWKQTESNFSLTIGAFCSIADNVKIFVGTAGRHTIDLVSTYPIGLIFGGFPGADGSAVHQGNLSVSIGSDVWIGRDVTIMAGVKIGHGAVIGCGSVVTKDVEPYHIVGGVPAKKIRLRFSEENIAKLLKLEWWHWNDELIKERLELFNRKKFSDLLDKYLSEHKT